MRGGIYFVYTYSNHAINAIIDMKTIHLPGKVIKVYDSIDEMPIVNFQKYNKYLLIDSGIGSDTDDIDVHIAKIAKYIKANDAKNALLELQNMRQNMYMIHSEISPKHLAFAALIHSINGKEVKELSDDNLKDILADIKEIKHSTIIKFFDWLKKKVSAELEAYFPNDFTSAKEKEAYDKLKMRTILVLESIINGLDKHEQICAIDELLFQANSPRLFAGKDSVEIKYDKQFESTCLLITQKTGADAKKMTVLQFYSALELIKQQAERESKGLRKKNNIK